MNEGELSPSLRALVRRTPLVDSPLGCALKLESLQATGSFKLRGACFALHRLQEGGAREVVAASAGNHGLGVALAARTIGVRATIVVPGNAAKVKREKIAALGAVIEEHGAGYDEAEAAAKAIAASRGLPFVSPFDDEDIIAGNGGWLAREFLEQRPAVRTVVVPVGGGGLVSGLLEVLAPRGVQVIGVQPAGATAMARSLESNAPILVDHGQTICSGLDGGVAERTFAIARAHALRIVLVDEAAILPAIAYAYDVLGQLVEPASATVIAAARGGLVPVEDTTVLVVTGGNLDGSLLDHALGR